MSNTSENPNPSSSSAKITLKTSDNELFEVEEAVAMKFCTVKQYFEDEKDNDVAARGSSTVIPLPNVHSAVLARLISYCKKLPQSNAVADNHEEEETKKKERKQYGTPGDLVDLISAANYLDFKEGLEFFNQALADHIQNKSVEYVRKFFGIKGDFEPHEEEKYREEYAWAFEGVDED
ncbi:SKP1-like protein 14 [Quercus suber]|uniref:SKP1-like protein n=1 Tax=Quercus suber TaxID=58331 RepID=A0AAW0K600_QUESU|nr:SKP1-like protein 14 [Quercus suber]POF21627.1 skp1-like protein 4 [Quercus suber]